MIVAGFGCRAGATCASLAAALEATGGAPDTIAVPEDRAAIGGTLARAMRLPLVTLTAESLAAIDTPTRSAISLAARGTGSVAEAAALTAAGPGARILVPRRISPDRMATCAIAEGPPG